MQKYLKIKIIRKKKKMEKKQSQKQTLRQPLFAPTPCCAYCDLGEISGRFRSTLLHYC